MKLISFAVISLLAITVSAQTHPSTSTATDAPQCDKDVITHKTQELKASYQEQHKLVLKLETPGKAEREEQEIKSVMKTIEEQLKRKDLSRGERSSLEKHYAESANDLEKAESALVAKKEDLGKAREQRYRVWIKLNILNENLERKTEQDAKSKSKTGASPGSNPHRDILQKQIDETCPNAEDLFATYNDLDEGIFKLYDVKTRAKNPKKQLELSKTRDKFVGSSDKLAREFGFAQCKCDHAKKFQVEFGWQSQNSLAVIVVQSFWQMFSKWTES
ncbi:hypothetical protein BASA50_002835 [Batrachochytrium salamandrivorans]|uniref:Uncharacterized protein n=1 Tax=Batrachochytrium salamandrivorans TaxID=1357716 RepID=A0ABQ8FKA9_9FUNG|nr:hypothetical protein BASA62_005954 [Batrachochytrium salamandrivorans]KAH6599638.1 hypothetical protein BASA50_002835 [Batrachochytrium salamandrivorans]KAH9254377.1 hypothetical protein BASA81_007660 [Batrachochytrium salamandrivorans]KAH9276862.1 hypothetical protein BASA83_000373 [Batrachochytrium salamandrivorans]KAJ1344157.1 hypothetical protein BSLG_001297 [Batrachochytrium salamandrivorans]